MALDPPTPLRRRVSAYLTLLTTMLIFSVAAPFAWRVHWFAELPAHFPSQVIAAAVFLIAIAALLRRYLVCLINSLVLIAASSTLLSATVADPHVGAGLELRTQNLLGSIANPQAAAGRLQLAEADVAVFQEYTPAWHAALAPLRTALPNQIVVPRAGSFGIALYTRLPVLESRQLSLGEDETTAIAARFSTEHFSGWIVAVHLLPPMNGQWTQDRRRQLGDLTSWAESVEEPVVFVGDFNDTPSSPTLRQFLDAGELKLAPPRWLPTWPARLGAAGIGIDLAIGTSEIRFGARRRLATMGSDHAGFAVVVATND